MRKQDYLVQLIHSLNANEKRYFKLFNRLQPGSKSHEKLFDALVKMQEYDATYLCKTLKKNATQLSSEKEYLEKVLLKAMRSFYERNPKTGLYNSLSEVEILMQKTQYEHVSKKMASTEKKATAQNRPDVQWYLALRGNELAGYIMPNNDKRYAVYLKNIRHAENAIALMEEILEYDKLQAKITHILSKRISDRTPAQQNETLKWLKHPLLHKAQKYATLISYQCSIKTMLYTLNNNNPAAIETLEKLFTLIEKRPLEAWLETRTYLSLLNNYTNLLISENKMSEAIKFQKKLQTRHYHKLPIDHQYADNVIDAYYFSHMAYLLNRSKESNNKSEMIDIINGLTVKETEVKKYLSRVGWMATLYSTAMLCFKTDNYKGSLYWLQNILQLPDPSFFPDCQGAARVAFAITHYQLGNIDITENLARSAKNYLKKYDLIMEEDEIALGFLTGISKFNTKKEKQSGFNNLLEKINSADKTGKDKRQKNFDYRLWIEQNLKNT